VWSGAASVIIVSSSTTPVLGADGFTPPHNSHPLSDQFGTQFHTLLQSSPSSDCFWDAISPHTPHTPFRLRQFGTRVVHTTTHTPSDLFSLGRKPIHKSHTLSDSVWDAVSHTTLHSLVRLSLGRSFTQQHTPFRLRLQVTSHTQIHHLVRRLFRQFTKTSPLDSPCQTTLTQVHITQLQFQHILITPPFIQTQFRASFSTPHHITAAVSPSHTLRLHFITQLSHNFTLVLLTQGAVSPNLHTPLSDPVLSLFHTYSIVRQGLGRQFHTNSHSTDISLHNYILCQSLGEAVSHTHFFHVSDQFRFTHLHTPLLSLIFTQPHTPSHSSKFGTCFNTQSHTPCQTQFETSHSLVRGSVWDAVSHTQPHSLSDSV
jgi:hypothetical protein